MKVKLNRTVLPERRDSFAGFAGRQADFVFALEQKIIALLRSRSIASFFKCGFVPSFAMVSVASSGEWMR